MDYLFVYGTLKKGFHPNKTFLSHRECLGIFSTDPSYTMYGCGFFPIVIKGGNTSIKGEIYKVTEEDLKAIDQYEEHPNLFKREKVNIGGYDAWMYFYNKPVYLQEHLKIPNGYFTVK